MVLFLDRVYGIEDQNFLLHLLEVGFLPDLRAAASLDTVCLFPNILLELLKYLRKPLQYKFISCNVSVELNCCYTYL